MARKSVRSSIIQPKIRPVSKNSISDEIVDQIMGLIERGELKPGQRLPSERELCIRFGAGRSSLREALRCLSIVGVLRARVGEGTSIAEDGGKALGRLLEWRLITDRHGIEHMMEVRLALEGLTAASVALNGTEEDLAVLDELLERMKVTMEDHKRFSALDLEFHLALAKACGNPLVSDLITMIRGQVALGLGRVLAPPQALPLSLQEHIKIVQKLRKRDPDGARQAMDVHLRAALARYKTSMDKAEGEVTAAENGRARAKKSLALTRAGGRKSAATKTGAKRASK